MSEDHSASHSRERTEHPRTDSEESPPDTAVAAVQQQSGTTAAGLQPVTTQEAQGSPPNRGSPAANTQGGFRSSESPQAGSEGDLHIFNFRGSAKPRASPSPLALLSNTSFDVSGQSAPHSESSSANPFEASCKRSSSTRTQSRSTRPRQGSEPTSYCSSSASGAASGSAAGNLAQLTALQGRNPQPPGIT